MFPFAILLVGALASAHASMYMSDMKADNLMNDMLLREFLELAAENAAANGDPFMMDESRESSVRGLPDKEMIPPDMPYDYADGFEPLNPKASIRDQEYLQHSTLWSHQQLNNYKTNDRHRIKPVVASGGAAAAVAAAAAKQNKDEKESNLPAYCTPPNPCPVGYTGEQNCIENFENTAAFSRDYQSAQDCMCDSEHMISCPENADADNSVVPGMPITSADFDQIVERFQDDNPFLRGEKLPIAAKKGNNAHY